MMKAQRGSRAGLHAVLLCTVQFAVPVANAQAAHGADQLAASVYECVISGQRVFSDQPCAKDAVPRQLAEPNRMVAQDTRVLQQPVPALKRRVAATDDLDDKKAACNKLRAQQADIQERMRVGYTGPQGEKLRERLRKLAASYTAQRCERYR